MGLDTRPNGVDFRGSLPGGAAAAAQAARRPVRRQAHCARRGSAGLHQRHPAQDVGVRASVGGAPGMDRSGHPGASGGAGDWWRWHGVGGRTGQRRLFGIARRSGRDGRSHQRPIRHRGGGAYRLPNDGADVRGTGGAVQRGRCGRTHQPSRRHGPHVVRVHRVPGGSLRRAGHERVLRCGAIAAGRHLVQSVERGGGWRGAAPRADHVADGARDSTPQAVQVHSDAHRGALGGEYRIGSGAVHRATPQLPSTGCGDAAVGVCGRTAATTVVGLRRHLGAAS
eukprot:ctg_955.g365